MRIFCISISCFVLTGVVGLNANEIMKKKLGQSPCFNQLEAQLKTWKVTEDWEQQNADPGFSPTFFSPTDRLGFWVFVRRDLEKKRLLTAKVSSNDRLEASWSTDDCKLSTSRTPLKRQELKGGAFTDIDLEKLVSSGKSGVIYAYSDQMHLSVSGYSIIKKVAETLKIEFIPVYSSEIDDPLPPGAKRMDSLDLYLRGMTLHYPSILVFSKSKILGPILAGRKSEEEYLEFIRSKLK